MTRERERERERERRIMALLIFYAICRAALDEDESITVIL